MKKDLQTSRIDSNQVPHSTGQRNRVEALAEEYAARKRAGESVNIEQYIEKYPELASEIQELFPVMEILDRAVGSPDSERTTKASGQIGSGTRLGEYQLIKPIGRGGMGVVYLAKHVVLGSSAAVKLLPAGLDRPKLRERFQREASAAARMHHPNIVRVFDYGVHGETLYYVMELVEGCGLNQIIDPILAIENPTSAAAPSVPVKNKVSKTVQELEQTQPFDLTRSTNGHAEETELDLEPSDSHIDRSRFTTSNSSVDSLWHWVARIGVQAADALDYAHSAGVIHRDIKPANLMIDADEKIHVLDFGLAKVADDHSLTATGDVLGTLRYMPPESFSGRADHRSDIYSLGLTLYELLVNQPAFAHVDRAKLIPAITNGQIAALRKEIPKIPRELETVVHKSVATAPADRYQSAAEFREDLTRFLNGEPVHARRTSLLYKSARWIGRNRLVSGLATAVFALAAIAAVAFSISENRRSFAELQQQLADEKQQLADERQQSADRIANVFDRFLRGYDPSFKMRETISREELLDDAAGLLDDEFGKDPLVEAKLRMTVGNVYLWYSDSELIDKGEQHLRRAVELLREHDGEPTELARALTLQARAWNFGGGGSNDDTLEVFSSEKGEATRELLDEAIAIHESVNEPGIGWAETLAVLAGFETIFGNREARAGFAQKGLQMLEGNESDEARRIRAVLTGQLAGAELYAGNFNRALELYHQALESSQELNTIYVKRFGCVVGQIEAATGRHAHAELSFKKHMSAAPYLFTPRVTMAIAFQGDWQRAIEWSANSVSFKNGSDQSEWEMLNSLKFHAQYLRLSGDDEEAITILKDVVQKMQSTMASDSQQRDYLNANYLLARMMLYAGNADQRDFAIEMLQKMRHKFDPTSPNANPGVQLGFAICIPQFPKITPADLELAEECIRLAENSLRSSEFLQMVNHESKFVVSESLEARLGRALVENAKGNREEAVRYLEKLIENAMAQDIQFAEGNVDNPGVCFPTLRIAEDTLVKWFRDDKRPDDAIQVLELAIQSREGHPVRAEHQINFAKARLGSLLIKLDRKVEAREVLSELAAATKDGPDCFRWLEDRIAADLKLAKE